MELIVARGHLRITPILLRFGETKKNRQGMAITQRQLAAEMRLTGSARRISSASQAPEASHNPLPIRAPSPLIELETVGQAIQLYR